MIRATFREALRGLRSRLGKRGGQVSILKFGCSVALRLPLAAALLAGLPLGAAAQDSPLPPVEYTSALGLLETGDTTGALALLRAATRSDSLFGPAFLRLGVLTTALLARAGAQHDETALADETRWALERARELLGPDPELVDTYWRFLLRREAAGPAGLVPFAAERFLDPVEQHSPGGG